MEQEQEGGLGRGRGLLSRASLSALSRASPAAAARRPWRGGLLFLLLLALLLALGLSHLWRDEPGRGPAPPPGVSSPDETVSALTGELAGAAGGWLVATLAPLHADPRRQAFEREALARRLGRDPGQPWRLSVRWEAAAEGPAGRLGAQGPPGGEGPARREPAGIALDAVTVEDEDGTALACLVPPHAVADAPGSPVWALLAPPSGALRPGETADWILFGRPPGQAARLGGLVPEGDALFRAGTGFEGPFPLRATRVRRGDLTQPLARLERELVGKSGPARASEAGDGDAQADGR